jgi:DNA-directed RNA polymerase specialized sigma subunit
MSSITKHIPEQEDIQQQIYLWIIDAVARYDEKTCIPFAAYLSAVLQKWVHNLNRKAHGRSAADNELKHSRAIALFETNNGRTPTMAELAAELGESVEKVQKDSISIRMVSNLRSMTTLDSDDFTVPLVAKETTSDEVEQELEKTLLSAALISTALEQAESTNNASLFAFFAVVDKTWNKEKNLSFLYKDIPTTILNRHETSLMQEVGQKIRLAYAA